MPNLEPTYLRYVYDSLNKGSLNAENAAALPRGFIGLYEQEFTQKTPVDKRKKVLNKLVLWALFKGPVSANFAAAVLELEEEQMKDFVDTYSSWFNSPESGKYQLYHERLRVYLLQKLKAEEIQSLNEKLISFLEDAIKQAKGKEDEYYALAHLHQHMVLESQLGNHYERLHSYVNQESLWKRQIQLSKGYAWSQNAVQQGIKEGARRNHEMNTIRSTVNSVKLMTQEQNSAEDILNLLNEGDFQAALKRAESWEGERQFKLYLLFIHELTIGTIKEADFRKEACKAVLEAIDQTPEDHSVLDWCKFYPELAVYKYHEELLKMKLDVMVIWKRGVFNLSELINRVDINIFTLKTLACEITDADSKSIIFANISKILVGLGKKNESQEAMKESLKLASEINNDYSQSKTYREISKVLMEQGKMKESLKLASELSDDWDYSGTFRELSKILMKLGKTEESQEAMKESLKVASEITHARSKSLAYSEISKILMEQGKMKESQESMKKSLKVASEITDTRSKSEAYSVISKVLMEQGKMKESLKVASEITDDYDKSAAYREISKALIEQGKKEESQEAIKESLKAASEITHARYKSVAYSEISKILMEQGKMKESQKAMKKSQKVASELNDDYDKSIAYREISKVLIEIGQTPKSLRLIKLIPRERLRDKSYSEIAVLFMKQGKMKESIQIASGIKTKGIKSEAFFQLSNLLISRFQIYDFKRVMIISLNFYKLMKNNFGTTQLICKDLIKSGEYEKSIRIASEVASSSEKDVVFLEIAIGLMKQGEIEESKAIISKIAKSFQKVKAYIQLSEVFMKSGKVKDSKIMLRDAKFLLSNPKKQRYKNKGYNLIAQCLMKRGEIKESLKVASEITDGYEKSKAESELSIIRFAQGEEKQSLLWASKIKNDYLRIETYSQISKLLSDKGKKVDSIIIMEKCLDYFNEIKSSHTKFKALIQISKVLMDIGEKEKSLQVVSKIIDNWERDKAFQTTATGYRSNPFNLAYRKLSIILIQKGDQTGAIDLASKITSSYERRLCFTYIGLYCSEDQVLTLFNGIEIQNKDFFINGLFHKIFWNSFINEFSFGECNHLYHFSQYIQHLHIVPKILIFKTVRACFFEKERNEEKLDMLSEVLDIKDWRRISASA